MLFEPPSDGRAFSESLNTAASSAKPPLETQSVASCSTGQTSVAESDDLVQNASMLLANRESTLSEQRAEFYRIKRAELDGSLVDLDDDEAEIRNLKEASFSKLDCSCTATEVGGT